jgi:hypothetical protein
MKALVTAALATIVLTFSIDASARPPQKAHVAAKPSSFAPRHTGQRVFGAPIQPPIMGPHQHAHPHKATTAKPVKMSKKKAKKPTTKAPKPTGVVREAAKN